MLVSNMNYTSKVRAKYVDSIVLRAYLLNQAVSLGPPVLAAVKRETIVIKLEGQTERVSLDTTVLEAAETELLRDVVQNLDVMGDTSGIVLRDDRNIAQSLPLNDLLHPIVRELGGRPESSGRKNKHTK